MGTVIQTRFVGEEDDIDDGLVLWRELTCGRERRRADRAAGKGESARCAGG